MKTLMSVMVLCVLFASPVMADPLQFNWSAVVCGSSQCSGAPIGFNVLPGQGIGGSFGYPSGGPGYFTATIAGVTDTQPAVVRWAGPNEIQFGAYFVILQSSFLGSSVTYWMQAAQNSVCQPFNFITCPLPTSFVWGEIGFRDHGMAQFDPPDGPVPGATRYLNAGSLSIAAMPVLVHTPEPSTWVLVMTVLVWFGVARWLRKVE